MRKLITNRDTGKIVNRIELEDGANWQPPEGNEVMGDQDGANIGDTWDGEKVVKAPEPPPAPDPQGLCRAAKESLGKRRLIQLADYWPVMDREMEAGQWAEARETLALALEDGAVTTEESDSIKSLMEQYHIPVGDA